VAVQFSTDVRNAMLDAVETTIGASPILRGRTGAAPSDCAAADQGTVVFEMTLPADFMANAAAGAKALAGTWQDPLANASGVVGHFRIYSSGGACKLQGTASLPGAGGDLQLVNTNIAVNQPVSISSFDLTIGNG
jgi:hypothetical protein